ncbi:MAG: hypothetical protein K8R53_02755 [Bacteroidales bacterium]|nr:hypothetical protein [Bacteroidales bacterium]
MEAVENYCIPKDWKVIEENKFLFMIVLKQGGRKHPCNKVHMGENAHTFGGNLY